VEKFSVKKSAMTPNRPTRIAIIGAGPAGTTLACLLARKGADAVVIDDGKRPTMIVGESLVPQLVPVFQRLGIEDEVKKIGVHKPGVTVTFDAEREIRLMFTAARGVLPTYAYNVPRKEFDELVTKTARDAGARLICATAKLEAVDAGDKSRATVKLAPETLALIPDWNGEQPDMVIDASGRRRLFAKLLGLDATIGPRKDVSHFAHYENCPWPEPKGQVMTMRLEYGWGWRIPLPGPRLSIGAVLNKDDARKFGDTPEEQLEGIINNDPRLARECGQRKRVTPVTTYANYQLISERGFGPNWATVGDAFGFVDPMLSPGLCMAMLSAEKLAALIPARGGLGGDLAPKLEKYIAWFRENLAAWQNLVDRFYDGTVFALQSSGMKYQMDYPRISALVQRHIEKNISGMVNWNIATPWAIPKPSVRAKCR
jgi:flavin-dependent dehydrogenase